MKKMQQNEIKLNLGAGDKPLPGYINVDLYRLDADRHIDLYEFPWIWEDQTVDAVFMSHFLEHVPDLNRTIIEVHRILKPGGEFRIIVPHARNPAAYDIDHKHRFTCSTVQTMAAQTWYHFCGRRQMFRQTYFRMRIIQTRYITWTPLDIIASHFPVFYEKFIPIAPSHIEWAAVSI